MNEHEGSKFDESLDDATRIRFLEKCVAQLEDKVSVYKDSCLKWQASAKEANEKLAIAVEALEFYAKQTGCECSPSYVPVRAIEALAKLKHGNK